MRVSFKLGRSDANAIGDEQSVRAGFDLPHQNRQLKSCRDVTRGATVVVDGCQEEQCADRARASLYQIDCEAARTSNSWFRGFRETSRYTRKR